MPFRRMTRQKLNLIVQPGEFAVCRLDIGSPIPDWPMSSGVFSITRTFDELSVVCLQQLVPVGVWAEPDWRCLRIAGKMDFALIGVIASLVSPLAKAKIGVFVISTFDTDYLFVKGRDFFNALLVLENAGHEIET